MARHLAGQVLDMADKAGARIKSYEVASKHMEMVEEHLGPKGDISGIYGAVRQESGLPYENK